MPKLRLRLLVLAVLVVLIALFCAGWKWHVRSSPNNRANPAIGVISPDAQPVAPRPYGWTWD
jgi:hypothetical protein